jgi:hypothetical protein
MAKRKMVQYNLVKNSIAAYFAAVEIHNKPHIPYRYETVTLLMMNAWELALKAYVKKYIKNHSILESNRYTISCNKALGYVNESINSKNPKSFVAVKANIDVIESYRNEVTHFYNEQLIPCIFALVSRCALNYVDFIKTYFQKDIMSDDGLFILPLGFKLPFKPEDFLSRNAPTYTSSQEAKKFIDSIVTVIENLKDKGIEDSIVLGFDIFMQSVKKVQNSDILVAVTSSKEEANAIIARTRKIKLSKDPSVEMVNLSDDEFRNIWKYNHTEVVYWCKMNIPNFQQGKVFIAAKHSIKDDVNCVYIRRLDSQNKNSASQKFYSDKALEQIAAYYKSEQHRSNTQSFDTGRSALGEAFRGKDL